MFNLLALLVISHAALAFNKDFSVINDRVPTEFKLLFNSLKVEVKSPAEQIKMIGLAKDLNENLGQLKKEHIFLLMKSEVIRSALEYKFSKKRHLEVNLALIAKLEEEFKKKQKYLSGFSKWIWQSVIAELNHRKSLGLITHKSFNPRLYEGNKLAEALRWERYLSYLSPWMEQMESLTAAQFNDLSKKVSWHALNRLNERALLFRRYASTAGNDTRFTLINIPQKLLDLRPEEIKKMQQDDSPMNLKEESQVEKNKALKEMEKITPSDLSPLSDDLSKELEKATGGSSEDE
jgi:hypothetical protein